MFAASSDSHPPLSTLHATSPEGALDDVHIIVIVWYFLGALNVRCDSGNLEVFAFFGLRPERNRTDLRKFFCFNEASNVII